VKTLTILALAAAVSGCAGMQIPADPAKMTAEQIKALAGDKSAQAACTTVGGPWGTGRTVFIQWDKGSAAAGTVTVTQDCQVSITTEPKPAVKP
jgi:hypothetical protein